ncbi:putative DnaJ-like protein [Megalodesulfovibrio gigas DSM 1382 = ATCC 19364]|uniref:Putative DnaJ-like protein n=1 Tax=Megalodesulfovibrio gigas (strain ATCC 19364 / DSM 1382 / NCIMB 9332 / VKM B-1759) TaxID=1121448 RepID=T2GA11_MEGG1|nr:putative DnaJ-like protein [Megalodesulfovibrio gigas DSM 1382 = ATCC 19364]
MEIFQCIAEERIRAAYEEGQFTNLPGMGRPLELEDDSMIPPENRMAWKILKNAGMCPPELELEKQAHSLAEMISHCTDEHERLQQIKKLQCLVTRMNMGRTRPVCLEADADYYRKIVERVRLESSSRTSDPR